MFQMARSVLSSIQKLKIPPLKSLCSMRFSTVVAPGFPKTAMEPVNLPLSDSNSRITVLSAANINNAAKVGATTISSGGLIATPTDTVYGIACDAQNISAISKIYEIKGRDVNKPVAICVSQIDQVYTWGKVHVPRTLLQDLLPGPVTLVFERQSELNPNLNPHTNLIGIRIPDHHFIRQLADLNNGPVALTSANFSNDPSTLEVTEFKTMWPFLQHIFDGGRLSTCQESEVAARAGSTVIDLSIPGSFRIIRNGSAYSKCFNILKSHSFNQLT